MSIGGNLEPLYAINTSNLGSTSKLWSNAYIKDISATNVSIGGNLQVSSNGRTLRTDMSRNTNLNLYVELDMLLQFMIPAGTVIAWNPSETYKTEGIWNNKTPPGWSLCDGNNGRPDLSGRFILGAGMGQGRDSNNEFFVPRTVGDMSGSAFHTLTIAEMPAHSHTYDKVALEQRFVQDANRVDSVQKQVNSTPPTSSVGEGRRHNNMPPYYVLVYIIKDAYIPI